MKHLLFSIFDDKAQIYSQPFPQAHDGVAIRNFSDEVQNPQSQISKHPSDYKLYKLGEFDDNAGELIKLPQPKFIAHGSDFTEEIGKSQLAKQ